MRPESSPLPTLLSTLLVVSAAAQGQVVDDWSRTLMLSGSHLHGASIAVDAHDAIYVTGHYPNYRIVTAKYAKDGTQLWQRDFANTGTREQASWITVDPFGDVVVAGYHVSGGSVTPSGFVTLKYDPQGNLLWSDLVPSTFGSLERVATASNGDVVVLGRDWLQGVVTMRFSRSGTKLWTRAYSLTTTNGNSAGALALDAAGNAYVTAGVLGTMATLSYDPAGNLRWVQTLPAQGSGWDLALSANGELYVTGAMNGSAADRTLVVKYDTLGNQAWAKTYPGNLGRRIGIDGHGDVVVAAYTSTGGYFDWLTHKLDGAGNLLWSVRYDRHRYNDEIPWSLVVGPDDEIYVTGQGGPGPSSGNLSYTQCATVRYSRSGAEEWAATSYTSSYGIGVARLSDGTLATVGRSTFTVFHYLQRAVWRSLHGVLAGSAGEPHLEGTGSPRSGNPVTLVSTRGRPQAPAWIVAGASRIDLPLFGGVLVPAPDLLLGSVVLSTSGSFVLPFAWPAGLPQGFEITFQAWIADPTTAYGFAATNAIVGVHG